MVCLTDPLVQKVCQLYEDISKLESLSPSEDVNTLFIDLVSTCIPPNPIDVSQLCTKIKTIRSNLIRLCGQAEGLLEKHYSEILGSLENPLDHLHIFPYYSNYLKLSHREFDLLSHHCSNPRRLAFVGSGPLPLTSIVLASQHMGSTIFHNYDIDASANSMATKLIASHPDLSKRMEFHTTDIMNVSLKEYDVVFLAALVGMETEEKTRVIEHLTEHMSPGAILMLRSAHGARAFLYPVVEPHNLPGFEVLSVYHPFDDVVNSVVIARKCPKPVGRADKGLGTRMLCNKCGEMKGFNVKMMEGLAGEDHVC